MSKDSDICIHFRDNLYMVMITIPPFMFVFQNSVLIPVLVKYYWYYWYRTNTECFSCCNKVNFFAVTRNQCFFGWVFGGDEESGWLFFMYSGLLVIVLILRWIFRGLYKK